MISLNAPTSFVSGDSVSFTVNIPDYPSLAWSLKYAISTPTPSVIDATVDGDGNFLVSISSNLSAGIQPGVYSSYLVFSDLAGNRKTEQRDGYLFVYPNPLIAATPTWARNTLTQVEAAIQKIGASSNSQVSVNGQTFTKQNLPALMALRNQLIVEVGQEDAANGRPSKGGSRTIRTRFIS